MAASNKYKCTQTHSKFIWYVLLTVSGRSGPKPVWPQVVLAQIDPAPKSIRPYYKYYVIN